MEKIIFFGLVIPILGFVLYLGGNAIMNGFNAKRANENNQNIESDTAESSLKNEDKMSDEIDKLNKLFKDGVLTQEEFEKAKRKVIEK